MYDELRRLASRRISDERAPQTLQAPALVHAAFVRLVDTHSIQHWKTREHFFAAAAEAMRRILVENARRKRRLKHGGERERKDVDLVEIEAAEPREDLIALDAALDKLATEDRTAAELVQLRYFAGLTIADIAEAMDISPSTDFVTTEPVGTRKPNPCGLYDLHGNAEEWCRDWHSREFYAMSPVDDPADLDTPANTNSGRVTRSGGFFAAVWQTRSSTRRWNFPSTSTGPIGFRVVITGDLRKVNSTIGVTADIDTLEEIDNLPAEESQKKSDAEP